MPNAINITISCDDNYARHAGVMLQSLFSNCRVPKSIHCYLIGTTLSQDNLKKLHQVCSAFNAQLVHIAADPEIYRDYPALRYGSAMYQRLSLDHYLPKQLKRIIYLDIDTLVLTDIAKLWQLELDANAAIGAVENLSPKAHQHTGFTRQEYFNSGVLLVDLDKWRASNVFEQATDFLQKNSNQLRFPDQCALNHIFRNQWQRLPLIWNRQADIYGVAKKYANGCGYNHEALKQAIKKPAIAHFIGKDKPWSNHCSDPFQKHYQHYLAQTPWAKNQAPPSTKEPTLARLRRWIKRYLRYQQLDKALHL